MTITFPLSLPTAGGISGVRMLANSVVAVSTSPFTGAQQVQAHAGQWFIAEVSLPPMSRADAEQWVSFLLSLNGSEGTFLLGDPACATPRGSVLGTPLVNGATAARVRVLPTKGWTPNAVGVLLKGDYLQLGTGGSSRLHKVLNDVTADASGHASVDIYPATRASYADNAVIVCTAAKGLFRLRESVTKWSIDLALFYGLEFAAVEAL